LVSPLINEQIKQHGFSQNIHFHPIQKSPVFLKTRIRVVQQLSKLEQRIKSDIVFTLFGPSYWRPSSKHLMGFALPWIINPKSDAYFELPTYRRIKKHIENRYKSYYIRKDADYYVVETNDVKNRLVDILDMDTKTISVISNTYSSIFDNSIHDYFSLPTKKPNTFRLVTITYNYPHKNLKIIPKVIHYLKMTEINYEFIITIDELSYKNLFRRYEANVINTGPIASRYCPSIYHQSDALFLPTLLECFSASYPEAMKMELPILTSDYSFARDICKDAALFFDALKPKEIADRIVDLSVNKELQNELIIKGKKILQTFETAKGRAKKYIELCEKIVNDRN